ncbi:MAG: protein-glutamate O-methyltransferase CheR [Granulosicoccus sp.]|nr:protein-glutamate O-methyltransferase CheR [Granulosicoccus sp.]
MTNSMSGDSIDDVCFKGFFNLTHKLTGISLKQGRNSMLEGRLRRRLRALELDSFKQYLQYLKDHPDEHEEFINQITTNETYFYRTPRIWNYLESTYLPQWYEKNSGRTLQIWSAASSTGEEAHTLGVLMQSFKDSHRDFDYRVHGTDIDTCVLEKASIGCYQGRRIERFRQMRPELFERYMTGDDSSGYQVTPPIKERIRFSQFNLFETPPLTPQFDLVLIRNVLIYFSTQDQAKVMATVLRRVKSDSVVIIGESESLNSVTQDFNSITPMIYSPVDLNIRGAA